ncbi:MAG: MiaB/RimO family radical SAM methylthiotransferase [Spirochaetota bacterium]
MIAPRVAFAVLGCKLNQYETDSLASRFRDGGYRVVPFDESADVYVINSCTVTNQADRKSRNLVNRALRTAGDLGAATAGGGKGSGDRPAYRRPGPGSGNPLVVVTGCFAEARREALEADGRTFVVGNDRKAHIFDLVEAARRGQVLQPEALPKALFDYEPPDRIFHTRSMVKIQDGCDNFCSFCIIPQVRGQATSRPVADVLTDVRETIRRGAREVVLTGVNMSRYRDDRVNFSALIEEILEIPGDFRLRISSLEPDSLDERFFAVLEHPKMCPHLHLCLQSGSERILLAMRRQYTVAEYLRAVGRIRSRIPDFNLTTDIIVGFPGETEADFAESEAVVREVGFSHVHTFRYSRRRGTRADRMPGQVPEAVKAERSEGIRRLSEENKLVYRRRLIGRRQRVLLERVAEDGLSARGYGEHYAPVELRAAAGWNPKLFRSNSFYNVVVDGIAEAEEPVLLGHPA